MKLILSALLTTCCICLFFIFITNHDEEGGVPLSLKNQTNTNLSIPVINTKTQSGNTNTKPPSIQKATVDKIHSPKIIDKAQIEAITSFDQLINKEDETIYFDSQPLEKMDFAQLLSLVNDLPFTSTSIRSQKILREVSIEIDTYLLKEKDIVLHDIQCSDQICGLIFESNKAPSIQNALNDISQSQSFKNNVRGGTLTLLEENGVFYGVIVSSISPSGISIK